MKTALLHYWLTNMRGGEKVLSALGELLPDADIFTHAFGFRLREGGESSRWKGHAVRETFVARLPFGRRHPQMYLPLLPAATRSLNLDGYDLVVSSESGPIKGIRKPKGARHVCYCHTPMRYLWDLHDEYYRDAGVGGKLAMRIFTPYLRREDLKSAESVDEFVANSRFVAERIRRIYGRTAEVVYPPVDVGFYGGGLYERGDHYLFAGAPVKYKRLDLAIAACRRMGRKLVIAGGGAQSDEDMRRAYGEARALLFPGVEDFGIVPVEVQAAGTPVIAFAGGGCLETVREGETGVFFRQQNVESLCHAIEEFEGRKLRPEDCRKNAKRFDKPAFVHGMRRTIGNGVD